MAVVFDDSMDPFEKLKQFVFENPLLISWSMQIAPNGSGRLDMSIKFDNVTEAWPANQGIAADDIKQLPEVKQLEESPQVGSPPKSLPSPIDHVSPNQRSNQQLPLRT